MNIHEKNPIINTPTVLYTKVHNSHDDINSRMVARDYPDVSLQPNYDPRPVSTKYSHFPALQGRRPNHEPSLNYPSFTPESNFYPGTQNAPGSGYRDNVNLETILRNQTAPLQHGAHQGVYIPSSESDLYKAQVPVSNMQEAQPHPNLFRRFTYQTEQNNFHPNIGQELLFNHTRTQLRDS